MGRHQSPHALVPGQRSASRRWHPGCRRCLLKGCERWFLPRRPQARYCSPACQAAARRWRRWLAARRYRATGHGRQRRRDQARRYRGRARQRSSLPQPDPPTPPVEPAPAVVEAQPPHAIDPTPVVADPGVGQRPGEIPERDDGSPLPSGPAATSSSSPRRGPPIGDSARPPAVGLYAASASARPGSAAGDAGASRRDDAPIAARLGTTRSCRHVLSRPGPEPIVPLPPKTEEGRAGRSSRSPVPSLGIAGRFGGPHGTVASR